VRAPRASPLGVSPVIAIILLVAITVVLASVVYIMVTQLAQSQTPTPYAPLIVTQQNATEASVQVADVSQVNLPLAKFQAVLTVDDVIDEGSRIKPLASATRGNLTFQSEDSTLSGSDSFLVRILPGHTYSLSLLFLESSGESGTVRFTT